MQTLVIYYRMFGTCEYMVYEGCLPIDEVIRFMPAATVMSWRLF